MRALLRLSIWLVAAALVLVLPRAGFADEPRVTATPGFGMVWPDSKLGQEKTTEQFGAILGIRILPYLSVEGRGHHAKPNGLDINHAEGNVTFWPLPEATLRPYVTAGAGMIRMNRESKFAMNGGVGVSTAFVNHFAWRLDVRDVGYQLDMGTDEDKELLQNFELFTGLSIGFGGKPKDTDLDGVPDKLDKCPATPTGAVVDAKGCPKDSDGDGVYDGLDMCASTPKGATVDAKGCPKDTDGDGVYDGIDQCATTPKGATVDAKGCPKDTDGDGVYDGLDQCAATPKGATVDAAGCPKDTDRDGVYDGLDKCPGTPAMTKVDASGCPIPMSEKEKELRDRGLITLEDINFVTAKADLMPASYGILDEVGQVLARYPELKIEVGGHADAIGSNAANQKLSEARAKAVLDYLLGRFPQLNRANFTAVGYGETKPVATNDTEAGRAKNRRVEFRALNREVLRP